MASLLNMSGGGLLKKGLPYDAEIEYLESTGTQYIVTDFIPSNDSTIIIDGEFVGQGRDNTFFSAATTWAFGKWMLFYAPSNIYWAADSGTHQEYSTIRREYKIIGSSLYINNTLIYSVAFHTSQVETTLHLFCHGSKINFSKGKIFGVKFSDNLNSAELIPVRIGTTGYMYDKVSKQLFGNAGTGNFILGPDKHKEFVDLGLPSGTLWAEGNIIKNNKGNYSIGKSTDKGCYFSWGNIDGHNEGEEYNFSQDVYNTTPGATLTGNISPTDAEHDAAVARIGEWCHIPTKDQFVELCNSEYTDMIGTSRDGVDGLLITSKINGNSIFLPEAGFYNGTSLYPNGIYWSSTFNSETNAYNLFFLSDTTVPTNTVYRCWGLTVRPVIS